MLQVSSSSQHHQHPSQHFAQPHAPSIPPTTANTTAVPSTASYTAIHNNQGDLVAAVADVSILSTVTPATIDSVTGAIRRSRIVVADGNLTQDAFSTLLTTAASYDVPVFFEPTTDHKCVLPVVTGKLGLVS